jgi:multimeric flavodoxin WrbA
MAKRIDVRKGMPSTHLSRGEFDRRFRERFFDPAFGEVESELQRVIEVAWHAYDEYRKNPRKRKAGKRFADPEFELPVEWLATRAAMDKAGREQRSAKSLSRILLINGSMRSDQTCPGEMSKSYRLAMLAQKVFQQERRFEVDYLDLSHLASEAGRNIYPCKSCVSTAMPLCHWPCSCYPNFAMGQVNDWMNEIYPKWVAAHGVMIVTPVNWYQAPSGLKAMIDRLVCADGGNPDPTTTQMKKVKPAKELDKDWHFPRHLAGRPFALAVHGDSAGVETLRRILSDWLQDMGLIPAGHKSQLGAYIGYMEPYSTSHRELDEDTDFQHDVENAARALVEAVKLSRAGKLPQPDAGLEESRPK